MDFLEVSAMCIENQRHGESIMQFDWDQAATVILEQGIRNAEAFIRGEEETTAGVILEDNHLVGDHGAVLESYKGVPVLRDCDTLEEYECFRVRPVTNWTASAVIRLTGGILDV